MSTVNLGSVVEIMPTGDPRIDVYEGKIGLVIASTTTNVDGDAMQAVTVFTGNEYINVLAIEVEPRCDGRYE